MLHRSGGNYKERRPLIYAIGTDLHRSREADVVRWERSNVETIDSEGKRKDDAPRYVLYAAEFSTGY